MIKNYRAKTRLSSANKNPSRSVNELSKQAVQRHQEGINKALEELISISGLVDGEEVGGQDALGD